MEFSNVTTKDGGLQLCETLCGMEDGAITSDATLLKTFTMLVNQGFDSVMPYLLSNTDYIRWDDLNHTDQPVGTFNIVSGQSDYQVKQDDNSLDILNITRVKFLSSATETKYADLERMTIDDQRATSAMSPNSDEVGIPTHYLERNNTIYLYPQPNYASTAGVKIWFEREQSYFVSTDTTKQPGIPKPFHAVPFLYASKRWLLINKSDKVAMINDVNNEIAVKQEQLDSLITKRNPVRRRMTGAVTDAR